MFSKSFELSVRRQLLPSGEAAPAPGRPRGQSTCCTCALQDAQTSGGVRGTPVPVCFGLGSSGLRASSPTKLRGGGVRRPKPTAPLWQSSPTSERTSGRPLLVQWGEGPNGYARDPARPIRLAPESGHLIGWKRPCDPSPANQVQPKLCSAARKRLPRPERWLEAPLVA